MRFYKSNHSFTSPEGAVSYTYDAMGRMTAETTTMGYSVKYGYNSLNLKSQITNARGQITELNYDAIGRVTGITKHEDTVSYTYDENGNVLSAIDKNGTIYREYDSLNRVTKYTNVK